MSEQSDAEYYRSYTISGDAPEETWRRLGLLANKLGLRFTPTDDLTRQHAVDPMRLPYDLDDIRKPEQFVSTEHAGEFREIYMRNRGKNPDLPSIPLLKAKIAFCRLVEPSRPGSAPIIEAAATREYAEELGLVVRDRKTAGFPSHEYSGTVVTAASFIDVVRKLEIAPQLERPKHINKLKIPFLGAFATYLAAQIVPSETPGNGPANSHRLN